MTRESDLDDTLPVVPFCPWECPRCGSRKPFTYGRRGVVRYHRCKECGQRYRSQQLSEEQLASWRAPPANDHTRQQG